MVKVVCTNNEQLQSNMIQLPRFSIIHAFYEKNKLLLRLVIFFTGFTTENFHTSPLIGTYILWTIMIWFFAFFSIITGYQINAHIYNHSMCIIWNLGKYTRHYDLFLRHSSGNNSLIFC